MTSISTALSGLTIAVMALHTAMTVSSPNGLSDMRSAIDFAPGGEPFVEASPHYMPRLVATTTAEFRESGRRPGCTLVKAADHAHLFCDGAAGADSDGLDNRPGARNVLWNTHLWAEETIRYVYASGR